MADVAIDGGQLAWAFTQTARIDGEGRMDADTARAWEKMMKVLADDEGRLQPFADLAIAGLAGRGMEPQWPTCLSDVEGLCDELLEDGWTPLRTQSDDDMVDRINAAMEQAASRGRVLRAYATGDPEWPVILREC